MNLDWTMIMGIVVGVACAGMVVAVILWLCGKIKAERVAEVWRWVCWFVQAAEKIYGAKTGEQKHEYVLDMLQKLGIKITKWVLAMVEAAVLELT